MLVQFAHLSVVGQCFAGEVDHPSAGVVSLSAVVQWSVDEAVHSHDEVDPQS